MKQELEDGCKIGGCRNSNSSKTSNFSEKSMSMMDSSDNEETEDTAASSLHSRSTSSSTSGKGDSYDIKDLESQREALQQAIRSLKERYTLELKHNVEKIKSLESQLAREKGRAKAMAARRPTLDRDAAFIKDDVTTLKTNLANALYDKAAFEKRLGLLKDKLATLFTIQFNETDLKGDSEVSEFFDIIENSFKEKISQMQQEFDNNSLSWDQEKQELSNQIEGLKAQVEDEVERQRCLLSEAEERRRSLLKRRSISEQKYINRYSELSEVLSTNAKRLEGFVKVLQSQVESNHTLSDDISRSLSDWKTELESV